MQRSHIVTGANGYLGSHLVLELLLGQPEAQVVCIARCDGGDARQRVVTAVRLAAQTCGQALQAEALARLQVVSGNPLRPEAGLAERIAQAVAGRGDATFWHVAATVRFTESEAGELERINTQGATHALELAIAAGCSDYNYVSTAYVCGDRSGEIAEQLEPQAPANFSNPYERSKFEAERRIVARAEAAGLAWRILRPSIIVGHSRTWLSASDSGLYKFCELLEEFWSSQRGAAAPRSLRFAAPENAHLNLVPVDVCVAEMLAIDANTHSRKGIYHLVSASTVPTADFLSSVAAATGIPLTMASAQELAEQPLSRREVEFARRVAHYRPYLYGDKRFERAASVRACGSDLQTERRIDRQAVLSWLQAFLKRSRVHSDASPEARLFTQQRALPAHFNVTEHLLQGAARAYPDKIAIRHEGGEIRYAELAERIAACARRLSAAGVHYQQRVALISHDGIEHVAALLAVMHLGAVCTLINPLLPARDIAALLEQAEVSLVVADVMARQRLAEIDAGAPLLPLEAVCAAPSGREREPLLASPTGPLDHAFAVFTSGSVGQPKLIEHRHLDPIVATERYAAHLLDLRVSDVLFSASRTSFAFGLQNLLIALLKGATAVIAPQKISAAVVAELIVAARPTVMFAVPTVYQYLLDDEALSNRIEGRNSLRLCIAAGERLPQAVATRWLQRHGIRLLDSLGSTEAFSTYLSNVADGDYQGSTGKLVPGFDAVLRHHDGRPCRKGERGVMWLRGPSLSVSRQDRNAGSRFHGGWYCTNDVFWRDGDGYFHFCGRHDEMFKVAGQWVSPLDLEEVLLSHPLVREAAITSSADGVATEDSSTLRTKAWVVSDQASPDLAEELRTLCKTRLDARRYPHLVEFVDALPRTSTGKLQRAPLRRRAEEQSAAAHAAETIPA